MLSGAVIGINAINMLEQGPRGEPSPGPAATTICLI